LLFALAGATVSCSLLIDVSSKQCSTDADCVKLGAGFANSTCQASVCVAPAAGGAGGSGGEGNGGSGGSSGGDSDAGVDTLKCPTQIPTANDTVHLTFKISIAGSTKNQFAIQACNRPDLSCDNPVYGPAMVGNATLVDLPLPNGFAGYLDISNPDAVPSQLFLGQPLIIDTRGWDLTIPSPTNLSLLTASVGHKYDPTKGMIIIIARDCARGPVQHVSFTNTAGGTPFYFSNMLPLPAQPPCSGPCTTETTSEGAGGFINIDVPGTAILSAVFNPTGHKFVDTASQLKAGGISYMEIFP